jgi:hypothetical protein
MTVEETLEAFAKGKDAATANRESRQQAEARRRLAFTEVTNSMSCPSAPAGSRPLTLHRGAPSSDAAVARRRRRPSRDQTRLL